MNDELQEVLDAVVSRPRAHPVSCDLEVINKEIAKLESLIGFPLPSAYRRWLEKCECATIDGISVFGIVGEGNLFDQQTEHLRPGWLNIANDGCGDYYALVLNREFGLEAPVIFVDAYVELDQVFIAASDFLRFVKGVLVSESDAFHWPFDRAETLKLDPNLQAATGIRLPWTE